MPIDVGQEVATLQRMTTGTLRDKYAERFGEATTTGNKTWLVRRITWRLQTIAEGDWYVAPVEYEPTHNQTHR